MQSYAQHRASEPDIDSQRETDSVWDTQSQATDIQEPGPVSFTMDWLGKIIPG